MAHSFLLSLLVQDRSGVLQRVCMLIAKRGFNIASVTVGRSEQPGLSRMTLRTYGDTKVLHQMVNQLSKLIDVIQVQPIEQPFERELILLKIGTGELAYMEELTNLVTAFGAKLSPLRSNACLVEMSGDVSVVELFLKAMQRFPIIQLVRTGAAAIPVDEGDWHEGLRFHDKAAP